MTMEVEARNLDKKVCVEGGLGSSRIKRTGMVCWKGKGGKVFHSGCQVPESKLRSL